MDVARPMELIRELCSFEGRLAGSDAERRAANRMAERLREAGRNAEVEPIYVYPQVWAVRAAHYGLGFAGSLLAVEVPPAGFAVVLAAAVSLYFDLNTRFHLLRRLFFRRASQNVLSRGPQPDAPARLVLVAHLDAARTGAIFRPRWRRREAAIPQRYRLVIGPSRLGFWALALLLPFLGLRMAGIEEAWVGALQLVPTLFLLATVILLLDVQLSDAVPGANDDASGVATALSVIAELDELPPANLDVWVLLTGAQESGMEGMRAFVRGHREELAAMPTHFVVLEMVGRGRLHYLTAEGLAITHRHDPRLAQLCEAIAAAGDGNDREAAPVALSVGTDALPATIAGHPAITLIGLAENGLPGLEHHTPADGPGGIEPAALDHAHRFAVELARRLDADVGRARAPR